MNLETRIASAFRMSDEVWAQHANPWSVWTRATVLPLWVLAVWSRVWWSWGSWVAVGLVLLWTWLNPRLFAKPTSTENWASQAVLGERVWLNRDVVPVPEHHRLAPLVLNGISALGLPFLVWGLVVLNLWSVGVGAVLVYCGKFWFLDRMVWLYRDMHDATPEYRSWLY